MAFIKTQRVEKFEPVKVDRIPSEEGTKPTLSTVKKT